MATDAIIRTLASGPETGATMPVLFIGHGSPMNAIEDSEYSRAWAEVARSLPKPKAILCVSAHWQTEGTRVTAMEQPRTIYDFSGFPPELYEKRYPAPGSPELARMTVETLKESHVQPDWEWGLDHGAWAVLCQMYPKADVPVVQLSLDQSKSPGYHYELGRELRGLRKKGVLIIGSGNIVHNLREVVWEDRAYEMISAPAPEPLAAPRVGRRGLALGVPSSGSRPASRLAPTSRSGRARGECRESRKRCRERCL
jgi:4,5-DOPA dioxygenase extradiol